MIRDRVVAATPDLWGALNLAASLIANSHGDITKVRVYTSETTPDAWGQCRVYRVAVGDCSINQPVTDTREVTYNAVSGKYEVSEIFETLPSNPL